MNLTLCGIGIPNEQNMAEKIAANRIHETAQYDYTDWVNANDISGGLEMTIKDYSGIVRAINSRTIKDTNGSAIDGKTIKNELVVLATDAKKIEAAVFKKFVIKENGDKVMFIWGKTVSFKGLCTEIGNLAQQLVRHVPLYKSMKKEVLLLLGLHDKASSLSLIPRDVINVVLQKRIEIAISDVKQKINQIGN